MSTSCCKFCTFLSSCYFPSPERRAQIRWMLGLTALMFWTLRSFLFFFNLFIINLAWHFCLISSTLFIASVILFHSSPCYLTVRAMEYVFQIQVNYCCEFYIVAIRNALVRLILWGFHSFWSFSNTWFYRIWTPLETNMMLWPGQTRLNRNNTSQSACWTRMGMCRLKMKWHSPATESASPRQTKFQVHLADMKSVEFR